MGEVYLARDTRLDRQVALKFLPEAFARDADRLARFEREAKVLASLNHPNIAAIYGLEESGGARFLVMEFVPGEELAGPLPLEEALKICRQVAEALELAHEKGVVHRDLKPANIKITPEGKVKVLDFGLAKALSEDPSSSGLDLSSAPTSAGMTRAGVILGTAAYMSPEQARGRPVDRRTDTWAFGCILYELLAGRRTFAGDTASDSMAAILKQEPDWAALPAETPAAIRNLLRRCLQKDRDRRLQSIGDARIEIDEALSGAPHETAAPSTIEIAPPIVALRRSQPFGAAAMVLAMLPAIVVTAAVTWFLKPTPAAPKLVT
jgi:serine/threonine protein kinase